MLFLCNRLLYWKTSLEQSPNRL